MILTQIIAYRQKQTRRDKNFLYQLYQIMKNCLQLSCPSCSHFNSGIFNKNASLQIELNIWDIKTSKLFVCCLYKNWFSATVSPENWTIPIFSSTSRTKSRILGWWEVTSGSTWHEELRVEVQTFFEIKDKTWLTSAWIAEAAQRCHTNIKKNIIQNGKYFSAYVSH